LEISSGPVTCTALIVSNYACRKVQNISFVSQEPHAEENGRNPYTPLPDYLFEIRHQAAGLTRNIKEWANLSESYATTVLPSTKQIYVEMHLRENFVPKIQAEVSGIIWRNVWNNLTLNHLPTQWISTVYLVVNDAIPNGERLRRHRISDDPPNCKRAVS
jgi:hypothetical protein